MSLLGVRSEGAVRPGVPRWCDEPWQSGEESFEDDQVPDRVTGGLDAARILRGVPRSGMMDAVVTVYPDWTRRDNPHLPADQHGSHADVDHVMLGTDGSHPGRAEPVTDNARTSSGRTYLTTSSRRVHAGGADPRVRRYQQALDDDLTAALRAGDRVDDDEPNRRQTTADVGERPSTQDSPSPHFLDMTPASHQNQQHPTSTSTQVSGGEG
jgi:hypothetical protein